MWRKLLRWLIVPILDEMQEPLAKWIDGNREKIVSALNEMDSKTVAKQICEKIKEEL